MLFTAAVFSTHFVPVSVTVANTHLSLGFRVEDFGVEGLRLRVEDLGFRI